VRGGSSNAQSTSWAVQGLVAAGRKPGSFKRKGRSPLGYLRSLQKKDGSIRYSRVSAQTPVWVTAQALDALEKKAFPLAPAPRRAKPRGARGGGGGSGPAKPRHKPAGGGGAKKPKAAGKPKPGTPTPEPPAATPSPPTAAPSAAPAPRAAPPTATDQRAVRRAMGRFGDGGSGGAWAAGALVAGVAALAVWRLARRRRT
jgi:hypothetical protein